MVLGGNRFSALGQVLSWWLSPEPRYHQLRPGPEPEVCSLQCLVTCGKGHKHRQTWCQFGEDRLSDRFCNPETKPDSVQTCQQQECAAWQVGQWGQVCRRTRSLPSPGATCPMQLCQAPWQKLVSKFGGVTVLIGLQEGT